VTEQQPTRQRVRTLGPHEKAAIADTCNRFITETLKPRFLPSIQPTQFNYPVDIFGKWRGNEYSFITRYRSGFPENRGREFDSAFARLDHFEEHFAESRFDVLFHRHTGRWVLLFPSVTLAEALHEIETEQLLWPTI
jgi:hypothetical protein